MFTNVGLKNIFPVATIVLLSAACNKQNTLSGDISTSSTSPTITVAATLLTDSATADSVYVVQSCLHGTSRDSIAESELPSSVTSYLVANYTPYTFTKAFALKNSTAITGYVTIIYFNDKPVGLLFDASGNFVKVLEQRERGDLNDEGWHHGGRFGDRGNPSKDTVSLSNLPSAITQYFQVNYSTDSLLKAYQNHDSSYVLLSHNNGLFATVFSTDGTFVARKELSAGSGNCNSIAQTDLPAAILSYLENSYPNYVFKKAFAQTVSGVIKNYVVFINANNTKYALQFDSAGTFVSVKVIN